MTPFWRSQRATPSCVEVAELSGRDIDVDVDAVEERVGEALAVSAQLVRAI